MITGTEIQIDTSRTLKGGAGVLIQNKPHQRFPAFMIARAVHNRLLRHNERQSSFGKKARIGRDRAPRCQRHVQAAYRLPFHEAKKNIPLVGIEQRLALHRMVIKIAFEALHRDLFQRHLSIVRENFADAAVGFAVARGVADSPEGTVSETQQARALDVQEKEFDRIIHPGDFITLALEPAPALDLSAGEIRQPLIAVNPTHDFLDLPPGTNGRQFRVDQVRGLAVDWKAVPLIHAQTRVEDGAVITRKKHPRWIARGWKQFESCIEPGGERSRFTDRVQTALKEDQGLSDLLRRNLSRPLAQDPLRRDFLEKFQAPLEREPEGTAIKVIVNNLRCPLRARTTFP